MSETEFRAAALEVINEAFAVFGLNPGEHLVREEPKRTIWGFKRGSAQIFIILCFDESGAWIQVISPILALPPAARRAECYEHLLKLNTRRLVSCAFGIENDQIIVGSDRSTNDLQAAELQDMILCVSSFADEYDDILAEQFGCELLGDLAE